MDSANASPGDVWAFRAQADGSFQRGHVAVLGPIGTLDPLPVVTLELHKPNGTLSASPPGLFVVFGPAIPPTAPSPRHFPVVSPGKFDMFCLVFLAAEGITVIGWF